MSPSYARTGGLSREEAAAGPGPDTQRSPDRKAQPVSTKHHNDEQPVSIAAAVVALYDTMPAFTAPATERAAWFDTKAAVFDRMATSTNPFITAAHKATAAEMAQAARETAHAIREQGDNR